MAYEAAKGDIAEYMERGFKSVCMDYVTQNYEFKFIGKLRKKDDTVDSVIDFLASISNKGRDSVMVARCRLNGEPFGREDLDELVARAKKVDGSRKTYALFSGAGFTSELVKMAGKGGDIVLVTLEQVYAG